MGRTIENMSKQIELYREQRADTVVHVRRSLLIATAMLFCSTLAARVTFKGSISVETQTILAIMSFNVILSIVSARIDIDAIFRARAGFAYACTLVSLVVLAVWSATWVPGGGCLGAGPLLHMLFRGNTIFCSEDDVPRVSTIL